TTRLASPMWRARRGPDACGESEPFDFMAAGPSPAGAPGRDAGHSTRRARGAYPDRPLVPPRAPDACGPQEPRHAADRRWRGARIRAINAPGPRLQKLAAHPMSPAVAAPGGGARWIYLTR